MDLTTVVLWNQLLGDPGSLLSERDSILIDEHTIDDFNEALYLHFEGLREAGVPDDQFSPIALAGLRLQRLVQGRSASGNVGGDVSRELQDIARVLGKIKEDRRKLGASIARRKLSELRHAATPQASVAVRASLDSDGGETRRWAREIRLVPFHVSLINRGVHVEDSLDLLAKLIKVFELKDVVALIDAGSRIMGDQPKEKYYALMQELWLRRRDLLGRFLSPVALEGVNRGFSSSRATNRYLFGKMETEAPALCRVFLQRRKSKRTLYQIIDDFAHVDPQVARSALRYLIITAILEPEDNKGRWKKISDISNRHWEAFSAEDVAHLRYASTQSRQNASRAAIRYTLVHLKTVHPELFPEQ